MPTAPITSPSDRISTPLGTGTSRPPLTVDSAAMKVGLAWVRLNSSREPKPMPSAPHALP